MHQVGFLKCCILISSLLNYQRSVCTAETRIIGGYQAKIEDFPYQLSLRYNNRHICGAVLVSPRVALTAAHCVQAPGSYSIRAGSTFVHYGGCLVFVGRMKRHPQFDRLTVDYDIAALELWHPLRLSKQIQPVALPKPNHPNLDGQLGYVTGWGETTIGYPTVSEALRAVRLPVVPQDECVRTYPKGAITERMFCAGVKEGQKDSCQGDSGGPFVINRTLYGIVSWGFDCAQPRYPGVYSNVTTLLPFLNDVRRQFRF